MNPRNATVRGAVVGAALWGVAVAGALVAVPLAVRERLPDPLAVHWELAGAPDRSTPLNVFVVTQAVIWGLLCLSLVVAARRGLERRSGRAAWWATLAGGGLFVLALSGSVLLANLDRATWAEARLTAWAPVALVALPLAVAALAGRLGRGAPDPRPAGQARPPRLRLRPGQRAVWVSRAGNPWLVALTAVAAAGLFALGALQIIGYPVGTLVPAFAVVLVVGWFTATLTTRVTGDGLAIAFGPLGWPVRRISLSKIDRAWAEERYPSQVGGWGVRGLPGAATIMLRGGDCLIIGYRSGGRLAVSVDDAERGASLINALLAERTTTSGR